MTTFDGLRTEKSIGTCCAVVDAVLECLFSRRLAMRSQGALVRGRRRPAGRARDDPGLTIYDSETRRRRAVACHESRQTLRISIATRSTADGRSSISPSPFGVGRRSARWPRFRTFLDVAHGRRLGIVCVRMRAISPSTSPQVLYLTLQTWDRAHARYPGRRAACSKTSPPTSHEPRPALARICLIDRTFPFCESAAGWGSLRPALRVRLSRLVGIEASAPATRAVWRLRRADDTVRSA